MTEIGKIYLEAVIAGFIAGAGTVFAVLALGGWLG